MKDYKLFRDFDLDFLLEPDPDPFVFSLFSFFAESKITIAIMVIEDQSKI